MDTYHAMWGNTTMKSFHIDLQQHEQEVYAFGIDVFAIIFTSCTV